MWEAFIGGAAGLVGLYVALRQEVRRSHELLAKDISHLAIGLGEVRADSRRLDEKIDTVRGELMGYLGPR